MKLGVIYEPDSANAFYRAVFPLHALERRGHAVVWPSEVHELPMREFLGCDLVHCYRRTDRLGDLRELSRRGVAISFDNDDNYAAAELTAGAGAMDRMRHYKTVFREALKAAKLADLTTTPSQLLADRYLSEGVGDVTVIENHLQRGMFGFGSRAKHQGLVVGWIAGSEHEPDLRRIPIVEALRRLLERHPDVRLLTVGLALPISSDRYERVSEVPFLDLLKVAGRIDIGIAPLADTAFNRCRSNVKLKEYASGGASWLASPVGPYRTLGEEQGGILVGDHDWLQALDTLVRKRRLRKRLARRALAWARSQTIDRHAATWEDAFCDAIERASTRARRDHGSRAFRS